MIIALLMFEWDAELTQISLQVFGQNSVMFSYNGPLYYIRIIHISPLFWGCMAPSEGMLFLYNPTTNLSRETHFVRVQH